MTAPATVEVTITPEAAERLAELGLHAEYEQLLEHTRRTIPGLRGIRVGLRPVYDSYEEVGISLGAVVDETYRPEDRAWWRWLDWLHDTFPPQVTEHFEMKVLGEIHHAG